MAHQGPLRGQGVHGEALCARIEAGQEDQQEAQEQIKSTYERFKEAANYDGGDFERVYDTLNDEYEAAQSRADDVSDRIESIEQVAADLFAEWQEEIALYSSASLKRSSEQSLRDTKRRYDKLIAAMKGSSPMRSATPASTFALGG